MDRNRGVLGPLRPPASIAEEGFTHAEWPTVEAMRARAFVGTAERVATRLTELAQALQLDELVVNTWAHDPVARRHSYTLLAQAFGLPPGRLG